MLIVIDSLRADRVDLRGVPGGLTPFLAELATKSTVYERAYAPSSWTIPVIASLMTGQYPSEHRATNFFSRLDQGTPTLAELLARRGYATTGVVANAALREDHGFARGFEHFKLVGEPDFLNPKSDGPIDASSRALAAQGLARLRTGWRGDRAAGKPRMDTPARFPRAPYLNGTRSQRRAVCRSLPAASRSPGTAAYRLVRRRLA